MIINDIINSFLNSMGHDFDSVGGILSLLLVILIMSLFEFVVYRVVSHRALYNKSFHITIMVVPFFIGGIVAALQSNLVITLGTIGALAIIRFRTAVKDPVDMIYILWSVFIGITCGCKLYETCILTSVFVTIVLILINLVSGKLLRNPYVLVVNAKGNIENELLRTLNENASRIHLKSRNYTTKGVDYVFQFETKEPSALVEKIEKIESVLRFSLLEYDNDDVM